MTDEIRVNFGKPMPLFPLPDTVLLPHAIQPLHIFERRYLAMVRECLDQSGQLAMATFEGTSWKSNYQGQPPLRPAVCVGQIVHHDSLPNGRHNILLHGVCRASISRVLEPDASRPYRVAELTPLEPVHENPPPMTKQRNELKTLLAGPRLSRLRSVDSVIEWFDREDVSTHALLELLGFSLLHDTEVKYRLLAEPDPVRRATMIKQELLSIDHLMTRADHQAFRSWPKGMSWN